MKLLTLSTQKPLIERNIKSKKLSSKLSPIYCVKVDRCRSWHQLRNLTRNTFLCVQRTFKWFRRQINSLCWAWIYKWFHNDHATVVIIVTGSLKAKGRRFHIQKKVWRYLKKGWIFWVDIFGWSGTVAATAIKRARRSSTKEKTND